jgi:tungstate transport system permease protein
MGQTLRDALRLLATLEHTVLAIVLLSLFVSGLAVAFGSLLGLPIGALIAVGRFRSRQAGIVMLVNPQRQPHVKKEAGSVSSTG